MTTAFDNLMAGIAPTATDNATLVATPEAVSLDVVDLALPYHPYQREALEHVFRDPTKPYGYVGLDMGLGKTPVGLGVAASVTAAGIRPTLIVVPPSLRVNWVREAGKFAPWLTIATLHGRGPDEGYTLPDVDVLILGDSSLSGQGKGGGTGWVDFLVGKIGALVVDEAHRFKNKSNRSEALVTLATSTKKVKKDGRTRIIDLGVPTPTVKVPMSGTPIPNGRNGELAMQVDIMGNDAWKDIGGKGQFWNYYAPKMDQFGTRGSLNSEDLNQAMVDSWFFRRLRSEVTDLPGKGRTALHLEGQGRKVKDYIKVEDDLIEYLKGKQDGQVTMGQRRAEALIRMTTLRKLAGEVKVKSVVEHVKDFLADESNGGVFIVAEHGDVMDDITIGLGKYDPCTVRGGMSDRDKDENVQAFIHGESRVMVGQITAAGVGYTFHGDGKNHHVVVAQLPWTPTELRQAEDRLDRLGQTNYVTVEVALAAIDGRWTIDERLWGMLEGKHFNTTTTIDGAGEYLLEAVQDGLLDSYRS